MQNSKIKPLTKSQILISIDRLTRFKNTETKYLRVFRDILTQNLIEPKFKKSDLEKMDYTELKNWAEYIFNFSIQNLGLPQDEDYSINQKLFDYERSVFIFGSDVENLLKNKINFKACVQLIDENSPKNLLWLKELNSKIGRAHV